MSRPRIEDRRVLVLGSPLPAGDVALRLASANTVLLAGRTSDDRLRAAGAAHRRLDTAEFSALAEAVGEFRPDAVVLCAAEAGGALEDLRERVLGVAHLLEALRLDGRKVPCVVTAPEPRDGALPEAFSGITRSLAEAYSRSFAMPVSVLLHGPVYGAGGLESCWPGRLARSAASGVEIEAPDLPAAAWLAAEDLAEAVESLLAEAGAGAHLARSRGPRAATLREVAELVGRAAPRVPAVRWSPIPQARPIGPASEPALEGRVRLEDGVAALVASAGAGAPRAAAAFELSVVIPARNEAENLPLLLDELARARASSGDEIEVIVVDDRSSDSTAEVVRRCPFAELIPSRYPPGKGGALRTGFEAARGRFLCMMDADFSHRPQDLPALLGEVRSHGGLVIGSRLTGGSEEFTRVRAFGNIVLTLAFGLLHGRYVSDALNGYKIFAREVFTSFEYTSCGYEIEIELLVNALRLGRPITEVPSRERARLRGEAKSRVLKDGFRFLGRIVWESLRSPRRKP